MGGECLAVDARDTLAYIGNGGLFQVLDVSDPTCPTIIGEYLSDGIVARIVVRDSLV